MNLSTEGLPGLSGARNAATRAAVAIAALLLGACSGDAGTTAGSPDPLASCDPGNPGTVAECGSVIVSFTDADGDFLNYTVDVLSLTLETANGRTVETLPRATRINFTDYVDLIHIHSCDRVERLMAPNIHEAFDLGPVNFEDHPHAGSKFLRTEGFGDVIVGA